MKVSNTLTRWHKIIDRINTTIQEKDTALAVLNISAKTSTIESFENVEKSVKTDLDKAIKIVEDKQKLTMLVCEIRKALGKANTASGVSDLLAEIEMHRKNIATLNTFVINGTNFEQAKETAERKMKSVAQSMTSASTNAVDLAYRERNEMLRFHIVPTQLKEKTEAQIQEMKMKIISLNDKLSDVNAKKLEIEVDDDSAKMVGLS